MTVTEIDFDIDLSVLVGPMDEIGCEHSRHHTGKRHDSGPATHYIHVWHEDCGHDMVYAACATWVRTVQTYHGNLRCVTCREPVDCQENLRVLGPVNG